MAVARILFLCTGNTCRSPMAEAMFRRMARERGLAVEAKSAGLSAVDGLPISKYSADLLVERGADAELVSKELTRELVDWADLVLTMTLGHKRSVIQEYPHAVEKIYTLKEYASDEPGVREVVVEREKRIADYQMKKAIGQEPGEEERKRLLELERQLPDYDIPDPFGGSMKLYRACAEEIEREIVRLLDKLGREEPKGG